MGFIDLCLNGDVLAEEIDNFIEDWHEGREGINQELHEYLGMDWSEYSVWATNPSILPFILSAHKSGISLTDELEKDRFALAARASSAAEATRIEEWLRRMGKI